MARNRRRRHRLVAPQFDALESRTLLSGVTIITHGAEFFGSGRPGWIDAMATAIRNREGASTAIYVLRLEPNGSGGIKETAFSRLAGPAPTSANSTTDETVL